MDNRCPGCDSFTEVVWKKSAFPLYDGGRTLDIPVVLPVHTCPTCDLEQGYAYTDARAEEIKVRAICDYFGYPTPNRSLPVLDSSLLKAEVVDDAAFRDEYTKKVRQSLARVDGTEWTAAWSLDVMRKKEGLDFVEPILEVKIPHLNGFVRVYPHENGFYWKGPSGNSEFIPSDTVHRYSIDQLGEFVTDLAHHVPSDAADVWHGLVSLHRVANTAFIHEVAAHPRLGQRGEEVVEAFIASFESGVLRATLSDCHIAFEVGDETAGDLALEDLLRYAVEARLTLNQALQTLSALGRPVEVLMNRLAAVDQELKAYENAVLMIDVKDYQVLTKKGCVDTTAWWGTRAALEEKQARPKAEDRPKHAAYVLQSFRIVGDPKDQNVEVGKQYILETESEAIRWAEKVDWCENRWNYAVVEAVSYGFSPRNQVVGWWEVEWEDRLFARGKRLSAPPYPTTNLCNFTGIGS